MSEGVLDRELSKISLAFNHPFRVSRMTSRSLQTFETWTDVVSPSAIFVNSRRCFFRWILSRASRMRTTQSSTGELEEDAAENEVNSEANPILPLVRDHVKGRRELLSHVFPRRSLIGIKKGREKEDLFIEKTVGLMRETFYQFSTNSSNFSSFYHLSFNLSSSLFQLQ